jgi:acyl-CoA thioesterase I
MKVSTLFYLSLATILLLGGAIFYYVTFISGKEELKKIVDTVQELRPRRIVAFGDSLTYGYGLSNIDDSYPGQLQEKLLAEGYNYKVINLGISGETSGDGLNRILTTLSFEPDIVLLGFGANDGLQNISPDITRANLREIVRVLDSQKIKVILISSEPSELFPVQNREEYVKILPDIAKEFGLSVVPSIVKDIMFNAEYVQSDGLHPNKEGYTKIVNEKIWPVLKVHLVKQ